MKIFLMTDMEGVCGVIGHDEWVTPKGRYYETGKELLTLEINAAVEGFYRAGAEEILVVDGHGHGGVNHVMLDKRVDYLRGPMPGPYPFLLDPTFDVMAWVGQHAKAGTPYAHMAHTGWFNVLDYRINGISIGEFGQFAMLGATMGIRSIFGSGDEAFCQEASDLVSGISTVSVKRGIMPGSGDEYDCEGYRERNNGAIHMHPEKARERIREEAEKALFRFKQDRESFTLLDIKPPFTKEIKFRSNGRTPAHTVRKEHADNLVELMNL